MRTQLRGFHSFEDDFAASGSRDEPKQSPITNHQSPITNHQSPITNHQTGGLIMIHLRSARGCGARHSSRGTREIQPSRGGRRAYAGPVA